MGPSARTTLRLAREFEHVLQLSLALGKSFQMPYLVLGGVCVGIFGEVSSYHWMCYELTQFLIG